MFGPRLGFFAAGNDDTALACMAPAVAAAVTAVEGVETEVGEVRARFGAGVPVAAAVAGERGGMIAELAGAPALVGVAASISACERLPKPALMGAAAPTKTPEAGVGAVVIGTTAGAGGVGAPGAPGVGVGAGADMSAMDG